MRNKKMMIPGIICLAIGVIGLLSSFTESEDVLSLLVGSAVFIIIGAVLLILSMKKKTVKNDIEQQINIPEPVAKSESAPTPKIDMNLKRAQNGCDFINPYFDGWVLKYKYEKDLCMIDYPAEKLLDKSGKEIVFAREPENEYDSNAVAVYLDGDKIGYVYKGCTQDMVNDWLKRDEPVLGHLSRILPDENKVTYMIGFYKSEESFTTKKYAVTKTAKKDYTDIKRADNLLSCDDGDNVRIDYDLESGSYIISAWDGSELGEMPAKFAEDVSELQVESFGGVLCDMSFNDSGNIKAKVKVFF